MKRSQKKTRKSRGKWSMRVFDSMKEADDADREYWWSRTPAERMRELERLRQLNWGYSKDKPLRMLRGIFRIVDMREQ
jgi:hypothetical protein